MPIGTSYPWKRYWVHQGESPAMDDGYFVEPISGPALWLRYGVQSNGVVLEQLNDVRCLVLLGDVGMGKSTVALEEAERLKKAMVGQGHEVLFCDLKRQTEDTIRRKIFDAPKFKGWMRGDHALTLILDSLDECWRRIEELESILVGELEDCLCGKRPPLFLRLTCRSAEWRGNVGESLKRLFPSLQGEKPSVQIYALAPLSKSNISQAAEANLQNGDDLLVRIEEKGVQTLASHPITFQMLFEIYLRDGGFPTSRSELYEQGCVKLCTDRHSEFASHQQQMTTTPQQRLEVASRLAAVTVFTNRYLINGDTEHPLGRVDVLEVSDCHGHIDETVRGEKIVVNRVVTTETLKTALFSDRAEGAQTWRHQSYAEFLAARYLVRRSVPLTQIVSLLIDATDNSRRLIPQLEETASWLGEMNPAVFDALAEANVDTLIRYDSRKLDDSRRAQFVEAYLNSIRMHEAPELDWQLKERFARLAHPQLASQLGKLIVNQKENPLVREAAIDIVCHCKCAAIFEQLIEVFLNTNDVFRIRKHAGHALLQLANDDIRSALRAKANVQSLDDSDDEFKGYYLTILWPSHLSTSDVLSLATPPKKKNYTGSYRAFLTYKFAKGVSAAELPQILDWLREKEVDFDILAPYGSFPADIAAKALEEIEDTRVCSALLALIKIQDDRLHKIFRHGLDGLDLSLQQRQAFWRAIVEARFEIQKLIIFGDVRQAGILKSEDVGFFVTRYRSAADENEGACWAELIFDALDINDPIGLQHVSDLADENPVISQALVVRTSCPLLPNEKNWLRQNYYENQKREAAKAAKQISSFTKKIEAALDAFNGGNIYAFWSLVELIQTDPDEAEKWPSLNIRLSQEKAWKALSDNMRANILVAALSYLEKQSVDEYQLWDESGSRYRPYAVANPVLLLLFDEAKKSLDEIPAGLWRKWVAVIFTYHDYGNGSHDEGFEYILSLTFRKAEVESLTILKRFVNAYLDHDNKRRILWWLGNAWSEQIKVILLTKLQTCALKPSVAQDLLQLLITHDQQATRVLLETLFDERTNADNCNTKVPLAGALLVVNWPKEAGSKIVEVMSDDLILGRAIAWSLLRGGGRATNWIQEIPPHTVIRLWDWLEKEFPSNPYDDEDGDGTVTSQHDMYHFRRIALESVIQKGTPEACAAIAELMTKRPNDFWLGNVLAEMRKAARRTKWVRSNPISLMSSFADAEKRLVRTARDLQSILLESIQRFEATLHAAPPSLELWNNPREGETIVWSPKDENNLSACLKRHFDRDLKQRAIVSNCEVRIRPRIHDEAAELVDILIHAVPIAEDGKPGEPLSVVVEVKCAWNSGLFEDMQGQLYARYLANDEYGIGIYAVAYFHCDAWNRQNDARKTSGASRMPITDLVVQLRDQAQALSSSEKHIEAIVVDARINRG